MFFNAFLYLNYSCQSLEFDVKRIWELSKKKKKIGGGLDYHVNLD